MPLRARIAIALAIIIVLGLATHVYHGPGQWLLNNWVASIFYEMFFMAAALLVLARPRALPTIAVTVCLATIALEFLQLWKPPFLAAVRSTFLGQAVLGSGFAWSDMPAYPAGCALGWWLLRRISGPFRAVAEAAGKGAS